MYGVYKRLMNSKQIIKRLKRSGFKQTHTKGDHWKFKNEAGKIVVVPHPKKDIPIGTL